MDIQNKLSAGISIPKTCMLHFILLLATFGILPHSSFASEALLFIETDSLPPSAPLAGEIFFGQDCLKRFSPYDSIAASHDLHTSPDSIIWYLPIDSLANVFGDLSDSLESVARIGFDIRIEPDEESSGPIIVSLDYWNPALPGPYAPNEQWHYADSLMETAAFTWYGKQGTDSTDPRLEGEYVLWNCPNGALIGITHARWMDLAGNNSILGSDLDPMTQLIDGYTTLNALQAVLDTCPPGVWNPEDTLQCTNILAGSGPAYDPPGPQPPLITYLWNAGDPDPVLRFGPRRFFTQGLLDTCLHEWICYHVRLDTVVVLGWWPYWYESIFYTEWDPWNGSFFPHSAPVAFPGNDLRATPIEFQWGHEGPYGGQLPDGLYKLTLELMDNAGNLFHSSIYVWLSTPPPPDPFAAGCPLLSGSDAVTGWIRPVDTVTVVATIVEAQAFGSDSVLTIEGNFQSISDNPNPSVMPDSVGEWYLLVQANDTLGWARNYVWYVIADSADLVANHCHGETLPITIRLNTWEQPYSMQERQFTDCVQLDLRSPLVPPGSVTIQIAGAAAVLNWSAVHLDPCHLDTLSYSIWRLVPPDTFWVQLTTTPETTFVDTDLPVTTRAIYEIKSIESQP